MPPELVTQPTPPAVPLTALPTDTLTPDQIGEQLRVSPITVRDWITVGITVTDEHTNQRKRISLKARKVGGRWKVRPADLEAFVDATTKGSVTDRTEVIDSEIRVESPAARSSRAERAVRAAAEALGDD